MITLEQGKELKLYGTRIAVRPLRDTTEQAVSGIVLPETSKRVPVRGEVVEAGPKARLAVGDMIVFRPRIGTEYELGGETYLIMNDKDAISVLSVE